MLGIHDFSLILRPTLHCRLLPKIPVIHSLFITRSGPLWPVKLLQALLAHTGQCIAAKGKILPTHLKPLHRHTHVLRVFCSWHCADATARRATPENGRILHIHLDYCTFTVQRPKIDDDW